MIPCLPSDLASRLQILREAVQVLIYHHKGCLHDILMTAVIGPKKDLFAANSRTNICIQAGLAPRKL